MSGQPPEPSTKASKFPQVWLVLILVNTLVFVVESWLRARNPELAGRLYRELRLLPHDVQAGKFWLCDQRQCEPKPFVAVRLWWWRYGIHPRQQHG